MKNRLRLFHLDSLAPKFDRHEDIMAQGRVWDVKDVFADPFGAVTLPDEDVGEVREQLNVLAVQNAEHFRQGGIVVTRTNEWKIPFGYIKENEQEMLELFKPKERQFLILLCTYNNYLVTLGLLLFTQSAGCCRQLHPH